MFAELCVCVCGGVLFRLAMDIHSSSTLTISQPLQYHKPSATSQSLPLCKADGGTSEEPQLESLFASKPNDLSSILRSHRVERGNPLSQISPLLLYAQAFAYSYAYTINKYKKGYTWICLTKGTRDKE